MLTRKIGLKSYYHGNILICSGYTIIVFYRHVGCTYYDIRLYGGSTSGMVQLCNTNGGWEAVCDYSWDCRESMVACHQLGYPGGNNLYYI